jgi:hypothetical protein
MSVSRCLRAIVAIGVGLGIGPAVPVPAQAQATVDAASGVVRPVPHGRRSPTHQPTADAGPDATVRVGAVARLDASRSTDLAGHALTYRWAWARRPRASQATLVDPSSAWPSFLVDVRGTYVVRLVVSDGHAESAATTVTIDAANSAPVADAGAGQTVVPGAVAQLSAAGSTDVDGDALAYDWRLVSTPVGSRARLTSPAVVAPSFVVDRPGRYVAQLVVDDGSTRSAAAEVTIDTANSAPVSVAGIAGAVTAGALVTLDGSGSTDVDGDALTYRWSLLSRPDGSTAALLGPTEVRPAFVADRPGRYVAQLVTNDGRRDSAPSTVLVTTGNAAPVARTAPMRSVAPGQIAVFDGSASSDADGDPLAYRWTLVARPGGSAATLSDAASATPNLVADRPGVHVAQLAVHDGTSESAPVTVAVQTAMASPVALPAVAAIAGRTVTLDGTASFDPDGDPITFAWSLIGRPSTSTATIATPTSATPTFVMDQPGQYVAQLIVHDGTSPSAPATTLAQLFPANLVANAGPDQFLGATNVVVQLSGSGTAMATSFTWTVVSMPPGSAAILSDPASPAPTFTADVAGSYVFQLVVSDGVFTSAPDMVVVSTDPWSLSFAPARLSLAPGAGGVLMLLLPPSFGGALSPVVALTSSDPSVAAVPAEIYPSLGQTSIAVPVTGGGLGGAVVTASAAGLGAARAIVGVGANIVEWAVDASGAWETGSNWSGGAVPTAGDVVLIDRQAGDYTVTVSQPAVARTLLATEAVVAPAAITIATDGVFAGGLSLSASLTSGGVITLGGASQWNAGTMTAGRVDVLPARSLALSTAADKVLNAALVNYGHVTWTLGALYIQNVTVTNAAGATWTVVGDPVLTSTSCGGPAFSNAGSLVKTGAGTLIVGSCVAVTSTHLIDIREGAVAVASTPPLTNSGVVNVADGASFALNGVALEAGTTFTGGGTMTMHGTTTVNGPVQFALATTHTGTVNGTGKVVVAAPYAWISGTMNAAGGLEVPESHTLTMSGAGDKILQTGPLVNNGRVDWTGGTFYVQDVGVTNVASATWTADGDRILTSTSCGAPTFTNAGALVKSGTGTLTIAACVAVTSSGRIDVLGGSLVSATTGLITNTGAITVASGASFPLSSVVLGTGTTFSGGGDLAFNGTTTVNGVVVFSVRTTHTGLVNGTGQVVIGAPYLWHGGTAGMAGGIDVPAGQTLALSTAGDKILQGGPIVNGGLVDWTDGTLYLQDVGVTNSAGAVWRADGGRVLTSTSCGAPTFANAGTLRKTGTGTLIVASCVAMTSSGLIDVQTGSLVVASTAGLTTSGTLQVGSTATFPLNGVTLQTGTVMLGTGSFALDGTTTVNGTVTFAVPTTQTGSVTGSGKIVASAPYTWSSGTIGLSGGIEITATLTMSGAGDKILAGPLVNLGQIAWTDGTLYLQNVTATNAPGGTWTADGGRVMTSTLCGAPAFANNGSLVKTGAGALTIASCVSASNGALIDLKGGSIVVSSTAGLTNTDTISLAAGTTFPLNGVTIQGGSVFNGSGTFELNGQTTVNGVVAFTVATTQTGNVGGTGKIVMAAPFTWSSGTTSLAGGIEVFFGQTLTMSGAGDKIIQNGPFVNSGTVQWSDGTLYLQSTNATNTLDAIWTLEGHRLITSTLCGAPVFSNIGLLQHAGAIGSLTVASCVSVTNSGTVRLRLGGTGATQYDRLVAGAVNLGGTLDVVTTGGFVPASGDTFGVVGYSSRNGETYTPTYGATTLTLQKP